jgi:hypothetical protein
MSNTKILVLLGVALAVFALAIVLLPGKRVPLGDEHRALVETHVRQNISILSPEGAVLGGTFFVTKIELFDDMSGVVEYEDGHVFHRARFEFSILDEAVSVSRFTILSEM